MQHQSNPELFKVLVEALPLSFLEGMARAVPAIYADALAELTESTVIDKQEMVTLLPHYRRAMMETKIRNEAKAAGLLALTKPTKNDTATFSFVDAGRIVLTASHVAQPNHQPRFAAFRNEHAELNELLEQMDFIGFPEQPDSGTENKIYCILLYGGGGTKDKITTFMEFAIPAPGSAGYVDHYSFASVLVAARVRAQPAVEDQIDAAFPIRKQQPKAGTTGEGPL